MSTTAIHVPAGWYPDPIEAATTGAVTQRRWWDGTEWTQHTASQQTPASPVVSSDTLAAVTASTRKAAAYSAAGSAPATVSPRESARAAEKMPLHPVDPGAGLRSAASAPTPHSAASASPARPISSILSVGSAVSSSSTLRPRVHSVSVWLMATMPVTQALLVLWVFSTLPAESSAWTRALAVVFPFVLTAALAGQDARLLQISGHHHPAPWITALFAPPVYLAHRGVRVARRTGAQPWPLAVWVVAQLSVLATWWALDAEAVQAVFSAIS